MTYASTVPVGMVTITPAAEIPVYASNGASGADLRASEGIVIGPGQSALVHTGIVPEIPKGYELQIRPRSGLAFKHQVTVLNTPGTIDSDYRGEIGVILINHSTTAFTVEPGDRIAQAVLAPVCRMVIITKSMSDLQETERGAGGFGHTGSK